MQCGCENKEGVWEFRSRGRIRREKSERRENLEGREQEKRVGEDNTILCLLFKSSKST